MNLARIAFPGLRSRVVFALQILVLQILALLSFPGLALGGSSRAGAVEAPVLKIWVDQPGLYGLTFEELKGLLGDALQGGSAKDLSLSLWDEGLPSWWQGSRRMRPGGRLLFVVPEAAFEAPEPQALRRRAYLFLHLRSEGLGSSTEAFRSSARRPRLRRGVAPAEVLRRRRWQEDRVRVPAIAADAKAIDTLWQWTLLSQQSSSSLTLELGPWPDLPARDQGSRLEVRAHALGWSKTPTSFNEPQHRLDIALEDEPIGSGAWNGREPYTVQAELDAFEDLRATAVPLRLSVPSRPVGEAGDPLVDLSYVDWVEVVYPASAPLVDPTAPLLVKAGGGARWLEDKTASPQGLALSPEGWRGVPIPGEGWLLPATVTPSELWVVQQDQIRKPSGAAVVARFLELPAPEVEYLLIAPPAFLEQTREFAAQHQTPFRKAVVNVEEIYDRFGGGEPGPYGIRRFLDHQFEASQGRLRYVLLVGDANWLEAPLEESALEEGGGSLEKGSGASSGISRNRIPSWSLLSDYGPAASDHFYARDVNDEAQPRFAIGRLPVGSRDELAAVLEKLLSAQRHGLRRQSPQALMLRDASGAARKRQDRLKTSLEDSGLEFLSLAPTSPEEVETEVLTAIHRGPDLVYFGGHGSRDQWQLGDPHDPSASLFFDAAAVGRFPPAARFPFFVAISCATAPFDHPQAGSLGETLLLAPSRGAIAYLGASSLLQTPKAFSRSLLEAFVREKTLGDALMSAKRQTGIARSSYLYNLLGDPAQPLLSFDPPQPPHGQQP